MKSLLTSLKTMALAIIPFLLKAQITTAAGGAISVSFPPIAGLLDASILGAIASGLYWLELAVRLVPTVGALTPVTFLLRFLQKLVPNRAAALDGPAVHQETSYLKPLTSSASGLA